MEKSKEKPVEKPVEKPDEKPVEPIKPFVPSEDEHGNPVAANPATNKFKTFKTLNTGKVIVPVMINDAKKYITFEKNTYRTDNENEQNALNEVAEADKELPLNKRRVLSEDDFLEFTSPESVYQDINGKRYHITELRDMQEFAISKGWKSKGKPVLVVPGTKSKIMQGGRGAVTGGGT